MGYFLIAATAQRPTVGLFDVDSPEFIETLKSPPKARHTGWTTLKSTRVFPKHYDEVGVAWGEKGRNYLRAFRNGRLEYSVPIDENFCWHQSDEEFTIQPSIAPIVIVEYTVSFVRLAFALWNSYGNNKELYLDLDLLRVKGITLRPYSPNQFGWMDLMQSEVKPLGKESYKMPRLRCDVSKSPDEIAFEMLKHVYGTFGHGSDVIPFFDSERKEFSFPQ